MKKIITLISLTLFTYFTYIHYNKYYYENLNYNNIVSFKGKENKNLLKQKELLKILKNKIKKEGIEKILLINYNYKTPYKDNIRDYKLGFILNEKNKNISLNLYIDKDKYYICVNGSNCTKQLYLKKDIILNSIIINK